MTTCNHPLRLYMRTTQLRTKTPSKDDILIIQSYLSYLASSIYHPLWSATVRYFWQYFLRIFPEISPLEIGILYFRTNPKFIFLVMHPRIPWRPMNMYIPWHQDLLSFGRSPSRSARREPCAWWGNLPPRWCWRRRQWDLIADFSERNGIVLDNS